MLAEDLQIYKDTYNLCKQLTTYQQRVAKAIRYGEPDEERYIQRYNSYMGFLIHRRSYGFRWKVWRHIARKAHVVCVNMKKLKPRTNKKI